MTHLWINGTYEYMYVCQRSLLGMLVENFWFMVPAEHKSRIPQFKFCVVQGTIESATSTTTAALLYNLLE